MRVRLDQGGWANLGDVRYKVEWETTKPGTNSKDFNYDEDLTPHCRYFPDSEYSLAAAFARHVLNHEQPFCGLVTVTKQVVAKFVEEDKVAEWQDAGDPQYVDSPTAQNSSGE